MTRLNLARTGRRPRRRAGLLAAAAISVSLAFGLTGCVASADDVTADLHASVVQIAERAVAGDYAGALAALALLDSDVTDALESGSIDADREQEISAAIDLVRADLEAAVRAATPAPAPPPADEGDGGEGNDGNGNDGNDGNNGNGNNGNGNSGNGNGNSGKNGSTGTDTGGDDGDSGDGSGESTEPPATEPPSTATTPATPDSGADG